MRVVYFGTPDDAVRPLRALLDAGHEIALVVTQPDRRRGRGNATTPSPVKAAAEELGVPVRTPDRARELVDELVALRADAGVVVAFGQLLPASVLSTMRLGFLNLHFSLLPRWRGAAPVERAILAGDAETGVTIMQMDEGLDTGAILLAQAVPITAATTAGGLQETLAALGARLVVEALHLAAAGRLQPQPQPEAGVTYAAKLSREEGRLDWRRPAALLERKVRALNPWPGVWFELGPERIKVLAAALAPAAAPAPPGTVLDDALTIACGEGALRPLLLQRPGRVAAETASFLRGHAVSRGTLLPCPATS